MATGITSVVREVTPVEVDFYEDHGWVVLRGLIDPEAIRAMLDWAERSVDGVTGGRLNTDGYKPTQWNERRFVARDERVEPFRSIAYSSGFARNAERMGGRPGVPVRYWTDIVTCKVPEGREGASMQTGFHQDLPTQPHDRVGIHTFWIALDDVAPEQGSLRFLDRSHRLGPLGRTFAGAPDQVGTYPWLLDRCELSPPIALRPGDATCHHSLTVHGAPPNTGDKARWSYLLTYFPADVCYTGAPYPLTDGLGLTLGSTFDHELFPLLPVSSDE